MRELSEFGAVARHRTAIRRTSLSRPIRLAFEQGLIGSATSVLDYGCGHGDDVRNLLEMGLSCWGWDPVHRAQSAIVTADVVNLGYVVNVIEDPKERKETLLSAWSCAKVALLVSAQLTHEAVPSPIGALSDGVLTRLNTFQKYYEHGELRSWIETTVGKRAIALAPGVFCLFRDPSQEEQHSARQFRSKFHLPAIRRSSGIYEENKASFDALARFVADRGRLPSLNELPEAASLSMNCGGLSRAFRILKSLGDTSEWETVRNRRADDLLVYMSLSNFNRMPSWGILPEQTKLDIRAFFGSYSKARMVARDLLFSIGRPGMIDEICLKSPLGKLTPTALYIHVSILGQLSPALRVFEGCARLIVGSVEEANIVKLHRFSSRISYLSYPEFDTKAHPPLVRSMTVDLQSFEGRLMSYEGRANPPILHRKEAFVSNTYPLFEKFKSLTKQEVNHGLYENTSRIGTLAGWQEILTEKRLNLQGHRVFRDKCRQVDEKT
jgi:DNA phosphorothioation-associated putative methyltransferase